MQGHIRQRSKGSWTVVVSLGRDPATGRRKQLWRTIRGTRKEAEQELVRLLHERDTGITQPPGKLIVADYLLRWLEDYARVNVAPTTFQPYETAIRRHLIPALGSIVLSRLRPQHIQAYFADALKQGRADGRGGLSPTTVLYHHRVLREALHHAVRWQLLTRNPADYAQPPRAKKRELVPLGAAEIDKLLEAARDTRYESLVRLAVLTGMRQGELLGLCWGDVDLEAATLYVRQTAARLPGQGITHRPPKTHRSRRPVALSANTVALLRAHRREQIEERLKLGPAYQDNGLVFATAIGTHVDTSNLHRVWKRIVSAAGFSGTRFHDLRHAHATLLLKQGVHPKIVSERLGHAGIGITLDIYSHVLPGLQAEAAEQIDVAMGQAKHG